MGHSARYDVLRNIGREDDAAALTDHTCGVLL